MSQTSKTIVTVEFFKESGKFYTQEAYESDISVVDKEGIALEICKKFSIAKEMEFTMEVTAETTTGVSWNKYLIRNFEHLKQLKQR